MGSPGWAVTVRAAKPARRQAAADVLRQIFNACTGKGRR